MKTLNCQESYSITESEQQQQQQQHEWWIHIDHDEKWENKIFEYESIPMNEPNDIYGFYFPSFSYSFSSHGQWTFDHYSDFHGDDE